MADTVTSQLIENGSRNWVYVLTSLSDGTGESGVVKVDGSSSGPLGVTIAGQTLYPGIHLKIVEIQYDVKDMLVQLQWDATSATDAQLLYGFGKMNFHKFGGLVIPPGLTGATGKILLTTQQQMANSAYSIMIRGTKGIHQ